MPAHVSLSTSFTTSLSALFATTTFATEDGNKSKYLDSFSYAGGNSSYSFGLYQFDVLADTDDLAQSFLLDNGFLETEVEELEQHGGLSKPTLKALNKQLSDLVATPAGAWAMASLNANWFNTVIEPQAETYLNIAVKADSNIASQLLSSPVAIQHMLDLFNQFGSNSTLKPFRGFLGGKTVQLPGGSAVTWNSSASADQNINNFVLATHYSVTHMQEELGRESRFYAATSGESIVPTQIEISAGTGKDSNGVTLDQLQNTTVTLDSGIILSVGSSAQNVFSFASNDGTIFFDTPYANNGTLLGAVSGDYADFNGVKEAEILNFPTVSNPTFEFESASGKTGIITIGDLGAGDQYTIGDLLGNGDLAIEIIRSSVGDVKEVSSDIIRNAAFLSEFRNPAQFSSLGSVVTHDWLRA